MTTKINAPLSLLGGLSAQQFFRQYWHKKPLLIRQAIPKFQAPISPADLFALAGSDQVESRLIRRQRNRWQLAHGPFSADQLPTRRQKLWTLLVQGANLHHPAADALLQQFRFIPDTRLDDLMISYASTGGGVGPHFDSYDVFLLQAAGRRQWEISAQDNLELIEGQPLKILRNFKAQQRWILEPGDMLYLPPHIAHNGIALDECMTWSIGFRAPGYQELGQGFLEYLGDTLELPGRYSDPKRAANDQPAWIDDALLRDIAQQLQRIRWNEKDIAGFVGEYLSTPKPSTVFAAPETPLTLTQFKRQLPQAVIRLNAKTRMLYRTPQIFINGESFTARGFEGGFLKKLAHRRSIPANSALQSGELTAALHEWYCAGWLHLA